MQIGPHRIDPPLILAPMAGVTDKPFRQLCRRLGAGLAVSEMTTADPRLRDTRKSRLRRDHDGEPAPVSVQIAGYDPQMLADAARANAAEGADLIDINMGCPAKKVCNVAAGSALLRDEALVGRILDAVVAAVGIPVTLKIRTGYTRTDRNALRIAQLAESAGIAALAIHGRTREDFYAGAAEYATIAAVKAAVRIPVIANGDITTPGKAREVLAHTGADALMIGRAAHGRPWIFREIAHFLATGQTLAPPPPAAVRDLLLEHLEALYGFYGEESGIRIARKHLAWYTQAHPGNERFRAQVNAAPSSALQLAAVRDWFDRLADAPDLAA
jgi:tRNA-dihydrouridine synthase B